MVTIENLIRPIPSVVGVLDRPSNYLIKELAKSYILDDDNDNDNDDDNDNDPMESCYGFEEEVAQKVIPLYNQGDDLQVLALKWDGKLALWKPGHETWTDIPSDDNGDTVFGNIAAYNGQLYATDSNGGFYMIDGNKGRLITKTSDHAIFDSNTKGEDNKVRTSTGSSLSLVEYDGQLCLFKLNYSQGGKVIMGHRKGGDHEQTWEWEVINSLRNKILFKINEVSFTLPAHLLDRKFQGDWICDCNATWAQRTSLSNGIAVGDFPETERGLESLESIMYPRYNHNFPKVYLTTTGWNPLHSFYHLPNNEYVSLFFPPPPWLQCYSRSSPRFSSTPI